MSDHPRDDEQLPEACARVRPMLTELDAGDLEADERAEAESHLEGCADCRGFHAEEGRFDGLLRGALEPARARPDLVARSLQRVDENASSPGASSQTSGGASGVAAEPERNEERGMSDTTSPTGQNQGQNQTPAVARPAKAGGGGLGAVALVAGVLIIGGVGVLGIAMSGRGGAANEATDVARAEEKAVLLLKTAAGHKGKGEVEEARRQYEEVIRTAPDSQWARVAESHLAQASGGASDGRSLDQSGANAGSATGDMAGIATTTADAPDGLAAAESRPADGPMIVAPVAPPEEGSGSPALTGRGPSGSGSSMGGGGATAPSADRATTLEAEAPGGGSSRPAPRPPMDPASRRPAPSRESAPGPAQPGRVAGGLTPAHSPKPGDHANTPPPEPEPAPAENKPEATGATTPTTGDDGEPVDPDPETPEDEPTDTVAPETVPVFKTKWLSNDESMSTATAQRLLYMLERNALPSPDQCKPHEMLNYYDFSWESKREQGPFNVSLAVQPADLEWARIKYGRQPFPEGKTLVHVAYQIEAPLAPLPQRRNWNLTFVVDVSGSMSSESKMDFTKRGLGKIWHNLKKGDVVSLVAFSNQAWTVADGLKAGEPGADAAFADAVAKLAPRGGTNLKSGLDLAYELGWKHFDAEHENRVVMLTDANTNMGDVNLDSIAEASRRMDGDGLRFSGVGVGMSFNGQLLDAMSERGRGAYVFLGSERYVDTLFGELFDSLVEPVAFDMRIKMEYPAAWESAGFYGEQSSAVKSEVQSFHFFTGSSQLYLSDFWVPNELISRGKIDGEMKFSIEHVPAGEDLGKVVTLSESWALPGASTKSEPLLYKALLAHSLAASIADGTVYTPLFGQTGDYFESKKIVDHDSQTDELMGMLRTMRKMTGQ